MSERNDGGPAFPNAGLDADPASGMTLRDYFAGQALAALLTHRWVRVNMSDVELAEDCYGRADALLAEREKPGD